MKHNLEKMLAVAALALAATPLCAQYPQLTPEAQLKADSLEAAWQARSDSAWRVALPTVMAEARQGRPYVPWASRPYDLPQAGIPAFPGAEGGGMYTPGGRGGRVLTVTTLADSGPGSLRWACEQGGARIVVFNVSGVIRLASPISVRAPYITIAGQTAPGDGVCVAGESFLIDTHDVIIRHMRFRRGTTSLLRRDDALGGNPVGNIIIDHCSCQWGLDENLSIYRHMWPLRGEKREKLPTVNVTVQDCISAKALDTWNHAFGSTLGGENCTFVRNLWASNTGRNPSIGWNGVFNFVNNVVFNWRHRTADGGDYRAMYNMLNNYYKPGPATPRSGSVACRILKADASRLPDGQVRHGRVYAAGNVVEGNSRVTADNWNGGVQPEGGAADSLMALVRAREPFPMPEVRMMEAAEAYGYVLANAGATRPRRDRIDSIVVEEVRTGVAYVPEGIPAGAQGDMWGLATESQDSTGHFRHRRMEADSYRLGIITDPAQMGSLPSYQGQPRTDTDGDGMPDDWERAHGLDPADPADAALSPTAGGYTNIETYINGLADGKW